MTPHPPHVHPIPFDSPEKGLSNGPKCMVCGRAVVEGPRVKRARPGDPYEGVFLADLGH